jgi:hypothetical protein
MIQRIQSVYLFFTAVVISLMLKLPLFTIFTTNNLALKQYITGMEAESGEMMFRSLPLAIFVVIIVLISLLTIFLYKNRTLQIRLTIYNMILTLSTYIVIWFFYRSILNELDLEVARKAFGYALVLPVVAFILMYLALSNIRKDEALIRSVDRLR